MLWRSHETPLTNCKAGSKLKWTKYCVLSAASNDNIVNNNNNNNVNNLFFMIKGTKLYVSHVDYQQGIYQIIKNYKKFLEKD